MALSVEEAQALAVRVVRPVGEERVGLHESLGRVLATDVRARANVPPHDNSAMDGYAVRAVTTGTELEIVGDLPAGAWTDRAVGEGEAIRIMTGAPIPAGAQAVVMVEHTRTAGADRVVIERAAQPGDHIRRAGEDMRAGDVVLRAGQRVGAAELAVLASVQRASIAVKRKPLVTILATGDELRDVDEPLDRGAIAESNGPALAALVRDAGGEPRLSPIVRDDPKLLRAAIEDARAASNMIVSSGGVSVGQHDHVKNVLSELGAELAFWRVDMKPGKPVAVAQLGEVPYYGLPGNPVSSIVAFTLFVRPAIRAAIGCTPHVDLPRVNVVLDSPLRSRGDRRSYLRARVAAGPDGVLHAALARPQGSHQLSSLVGMNSFVLVEPGEIDLSVGSTVSALLFAPIFAI